MRRSLRFLLAALVAALVWWGSGTALATPSHTQMRTVTIAVTTTSGTVWGRVKATYTVHGHTTTHTCSRAKCTIHVPQGVMLHLRQTPISSMTWPFKDWTVKMGQHTRTLKANTITVKITGSTRVTAVYVYA